MNEKKVVAVIVEGVSEEAALGTIMKEYFSNSEIQFIVIHGDITLKNFVSASNIVREISKQIDSVLFKYRYKITDFLKIIHIVDMDGVYIPSKDIKQKDVENVHYFTDRIEARNIDFIKSRNKLKGDILYKLRNTKIIREIPYHVFFNSCNLEHVLFGELKLFTEDEKEKMSDDFAEKYEGNIGKFIEFISNQEISVKGSYKETWDYIEKERNSLNRHSNMSIIFK